MAVSSFFPTLKNILFKFFKQSAATLKNILVLVLIFGLERIFEKDVFKCPRNRYFLYGSLFLFCPAVCLFSLTLLLNTKFWEVLTGCHLNNFRCRWVVRRVSSIIVQAFLPATVWIVVALVQTNYYVCARVGPKEAALQAALKNAKGTVSRKEVKQRIEALFVDVQTESHIIAWLLFVSLIVFAFVVVCIKRCWFRRAKGVLLDMEAYDKIEAQAASEYLIEEMERIAKEEGENFVKTIIKEKEEENTGVKRGWVKEILHEVSSMYPRMTGNLSQPYKAKLIKTPKPNNEIQVNTNVVLESSL